MITELKSFVNSLFLHGDTIPEKLDISEATFNLCEMMKDGVEFPEGITPAKFMLLWNRQVDRERKWATWCEDDDSDEI